jgi:predicted permease
LLERVRTLPGVEQAGLAYMVPVDLHFGRDSVFIEGRLPERDAAAPRVMTNRVSPGYFGAMRTRLLSGREFTEQDSDNTLRVAIVNETFARRFWPGEDAIGKRFSTGAADAPKYQVIGVAEDGKYANLNEDPKPFVYRALWQTGIGSTNLIVRAKAEPGKPTSNLMAAVRNELRQMDPNLPIASAKTLVEHMSFPLLPARLAAGVLGSFGLLALLLAAIGLYGVMAFAVSTRTREIGVRMALGARSADVLRLVIGQGMKPALAGLVIGLLASLAVTRLMKTLLFGVSATDPLTFVLITVLLASVALLACWVPARRATKVDPATALRCE